MHLVIFIQVESFLKVSLGTKNLVPNSLYIYIYMLLLSKKKSVSKDVVLYCSKKNIFINPHHRIPYK